MTTQDLLITPLVLFLVYLLAYATRPYFTDAVTYRYYLPGLTVKIVGAIAVGFIYQFYYGGGRPSGDTFNYFANAAVIHEAFGDSFNTGIKLLLADGTYTPEIFPYATRIYWFRSPTEYFVIRVVAVLGLFTFRTYSAVAVLFALLSFSGVWALFRTFYRFFPALHYKLAIAILFVPSVVFWGSGILKDTITLGALGWATWAIARLFIARKGVIVAAIVLLLALYTIYAVKIYIVLCFLPAALLWVFLANVSQVRSVLVRSLITPLMLVAVVVLSYFAVVSIGEDNNRYAVDKLSQTAEITARYLTYVGEKQGGSVYTLGDNFDFSPAGMLRKFPLAVNVTLFRPYLWEAYNPVMLLSALESLITLLLTGYILFQVGIRRTLKYLGARPIVLFCLLFAVAFSFAVGISTYNFGSLVRYKIPMFPFYLSGLFILQHLAQYRPQPNARPANA
ncbi:MAG: hypothetical protein WA958_18330 [Tunicatimonas sp.]